MTTPLFTTILKLGKTTKGTQVYSDPNGALGGPSPSLYIKKTAADHNGFAGNWPAEIEVTVTGHHPSTSAD